MVPGITQLLDELNAELDELEKRVEPTWHGLVEPVERLTDRLSLAWGTVSHLKVIALPDQLLADPVLTIGTCLCTRASSIRTPHLTCKGRSNGKVETGQPAVTISKAPVERHALSRPHQHICRCMHPACG